MKARILVVDDQKDLRGQIVMALSDPRLTSEEYEVLQAGDVSEVKQLLNGPEVDVVLLDLILPGGDGFEVLSTIKKKWPDTEVILMTGQLDGEDKIAAAVEAVKRGAFHFLSKPFAWANLIVTVQRALEHKRAKEERRTLREELVASGGIRPVFKSAAMRAVIAMVEKIASSEVSVFITGETGTGKEVICNALHALTSTRKRTTYKSKIVQRSQGN